MNLTEQKGGTKSKNPSECIRKMCLTPEFISAIKNKCFCFNIDVKLRSFWSKKGIKYTKTHKQMR